VNILYRKSCIHRQFSATFAYKYYFYFFSRTAMNRKSYFLLIFFSVCKLVLQFSLLHGDYDLHRDEYMHLDLAQHPAWGYFSVPPFIAFLAIIIHALGNGEFWVHLLPALAGVVTLWWVWEFVRREGGDTFALCLSAVLVIFSPLLRLNALFQPNSFDVMAWTGVYFYLYSYYRQGKSGYLYVAALLLAIGFLNKYNVFFLVLGLLPALALLPERKIFRDKHFYAALFLFVLLISPNLIWQYRHDFPVFEHMRLLRTRHLVHVSRSDFFKDQFIFLFCSLPFVLGLWRLKREHFWFVLSVVISIIWFVYFKAKSYYALGSYPFLWGLSALYFSKVSAARWRWILLLWPIGLTVWSILRYYPVKSAEQLYHEAVQNGVFHRWEDGTDHRIAQDYADMVGWKELAAKTEAALNTFEDTDRVLVLCDNYGQAGAINYYSKGRVKAQSFHGDYGVWLDTDAPYLHLIRVKTADGSDTEMSETAPHFNSAQKLDSISNPIAREFGTSVFVFRDAKYPFNAPLKEEQQAEVYPGLLRK
jgi:hypothetical protein